MPQSSKRPQEAPGSPRMHQEAPRSPKGTRKPRAAPGATRRRQDAPGSTPEKSIYQSRLKFEVRFTSDLESSTDSKINKRLTRYTHFNQQRSKIDARVSPVNQQLLVAFVPLKYDLGDECENQKMRDVSRDILVLVS